MPQYDEMDEKAVIEEKSVSDARESAVATRERAGA